MYKFKLAAVTKKSDAIHKASKENEDSYFMKYNDTIIALNDTNFETEVELDEEDYLVVAVFDGISSCKDAKATTLYAINYLSNPDCKLVDASIKDIRSIMKELNRELLKEYLDPGCTLSMLVLQGNRFTSINIGDSPIFKVDEEGALGKLYEPDTLANLKFEHLVEIEERDYNALLDYLGNMQNNNTVHINKGLIENNNFLVSSDGLFNTALIKRGVIKTFTDLECDDDIAQKIMNDYVTDFHDDITFVTLKNLS